jgi:hypothetical protein
LFGLWLGLVPWTWWIVFGGGILLAGNILVELTSPEDTDATSAETPQENG